MRFWLYASPLHKRGSYGKIEVWMDFSGGRVQLSMSS